MVLGIIGTQTLIIVMVIALLVFGPQKLPEIGRQIGQAMRELRKMSGDMTKALDLEQHISMDTNHNYGSYSNYTDSSTYHEPMDQYGLSDTHAYEHGTLQLEPAPPSKTLEISGIGVSVDGTDVANISNDDSGVVEADVVAEGPGDDCSEDDQLASLETADVSPDQRSENVSPETTVGESVDHLEMVDIQDSPAIATEGLADLTSDGVA